MGRTVANPGYDDAWTSEVEEISMGVYRVTMTHWLGAKVERTVLEGSMGGLLDEVRRDADELNVELDRRIRTVLRAAIIDAAEVLESVGESWWSTQLREAARSGPDARRVLRWFGGMGSFSDLVLAEVNGHHVPAADRVAKNERLEALRTRIHELASRLKP